MPTLPDLIHASSSPSKRTWPQERAFRKAIADADKLQAIATGMAHCLKLAKQSYTMRFAEPSPDELLAELKALGLNP